MTSNEYYNLITGAKCILTEDIETYGIKWQKGDIIEVAFFNPVMLDGDVVFFNLNVKYKDRPSYKRLGIVYVLKALQVLTVETRPIVSQFTHKFNAGDTVWRMNYNKPESHFIDRLQYNEYSNDNQNFEYICNDGLVLDDSCAIYGSKEELLDSLR